MSLNLLHTASNKVAFVVPTPKSVSALFTKNSFSTVMAGMMSAAVVEDEIISFVSSLKRARRVITFSINLHWCRVRVTGNSCSVVHKLAEEVDLSQC